MAVGDNSLGKLSHLYGIITAGVPTVAALTLTAADVRPVKARESLRSRLLPAP